MFDEFIGTNFYREHEPLYSHGWVLVFLCWVSLLCQLAYGVGPIPFIICWILSFALLVLILIVLICKQEEKRQKLHQARWQFLEDRARSLRIVLEEISTSVDSKYLKIKPDCSTTFVEVGNWPHCEPWEPDIVWMIESVSWRNYFGYSAKKGKYYCKELGFKLTQTEYRFPRKYRKYDCWTRTLVLPDEQSVKEYLIKLVNEKVAFYKHREKG